MKLILEQNRINEVEKVPKETVEKSVVYNWRTIDGEEIQVFDLENWKLAPIVRYLIESKWWGSMIWIIVIWIFSVIIFLMIVWFVFSWTDKEPVKQTQNLPLVEIKENVVNEEKEKEEIKPDNEDLLIQSEIQIYKDLAFEAETAYANLNYRNEQLRLNNLNLLNENTELKKKIENVETLKWTINMLESELKIKKKRELEAPEDGFVYYLWEYLYEKCEINKTNPCLELYYDYLKE